MAQKKGRLKVLRQLLEKKAYDNQEDLLIDLEKEGFKTTQSTLSRDMRSMQVYRVYNAAGRAIYVLPTVGVANRVSQRRNRERLAQSFGFLSCLPWVWLAACRKEETASGLRRVSGFFLLSFPAILLC